MQNLLNEVIWAKIPGSETLQQYKLVEILDSNFAEEVYIVEELKYIDGRKARIAVLDLYIDDTLNLINKNKVKL